MEAEMVPTLSPLLQGADQWSEVLLLLPLLVALEAVLSADNAIALAAISRRLHDPQLQRQALNLGLALALIFRMLLIVAARWVLHAWPLQLLAAGYLLWLCGRHLLGLDAGAAEGTDEGTVPASGAEAAVVPLAGQQPAHRQGQGVGASLSGIALTLALTDLAFSLDSVAAAVAVTDRLALVMAGGLLGVLALRLTAGLFVRWLELYSRLETAGYLAVGLVGIRLLLRLLLPDLEIPEWGLLLVVTGLFLWGFSRREEPGSPEVVASVAANGAGTLPPPPASPSCHVAATLPQDDNAADSASDVRAASLAAAERMPPAAAETLPLAGLPASDQDKP